MLIRRAR